MARLYTKICLVVFCYLSYEYLIINKVFKAPSVVSSLKKLLPKGTDLSPAAGHPISFWLGWIGFGFMATLLLYSIRKRISALKNFGKLSGWLDFHIFCGMIGPIFILFHCNFKVGGLVAISFWSMVVSASSGVVGRYFYFQLLSSRSQIQTKVRFYETGFGKLCTAQNIDPKIISGLKQKAIVTACGVNPANRQGISFFSVVINSIIGDINLFLNPPKLLPNMHKSLAKRLREYGRLQRQLFFMDSYKKFMGYWHAFHLPFAIFMYIVAVIHIITALLFKVHA